jgi:hypothetical protein
MLSKKRNREILKESKNLSIQDNYMNFAMYNNLNKFFSYFFIKNLEIKIKEII